MSINMLIFFMKVLIKGPALSVIHFKDNLKNLYNKR
jgi:hypothetical protein